MRFPKARGLEYAHLPRMLALFIGIAAGLIAAFVSLSWFFATGEETDDSMRESTRWFMPWWGTKFGIWTTLSCFVGHVTYSLLIYCFPKVFVPL